jgi:hypothetical protein
VITGWIFLALASVYSLLVADLVLESAFSGAKKLYLFGNLIAEPGKPEGTWVVTALAATAGLALASAIAYLHGRRLEQRMAADLDDRWQELSRQAAGTEARNELISWRIAELHDQIERQTAKRDLLADEVSAQEAELARLREAIRDHRSLAVEKKVIKVPEAKPADTELDDSWSLDELARRRSRN